jgi:hypothetical protein
MDIEMTWTILYMDEDRNLLHKPVNAPHGRQEAWDYIREKFGMSGELNIIAIVPGNHNIFTESDHLAE